MPISRMIVEEYYDELEAMEMAVQEAWIVHGIATRLIQEGVWFGVDPVVRDYYMQNAINWGLEFYYASATACTSSSSSI